MASKCKDCHIEIKDGIGRFNFPSGTRCMKCGRKIDSHLKKAEMELELYKKLSGDSGSRIKHF